MTYDFLFSNIPLVKLINGNRKLWLKNSFLKLYIWRHRQRDREHNTRRIGKNTEQQKIKKREREKYTNGEQPVR